MAGQLKNCLDICFSVSYQSYTLLIHFETMLGGVMTVIPIASTKNRPTIDSIVSVCLESENEWDICRQLVYLNVCSEKLSGSSIGKVTNRGEIEILAQFGNLDFLDEFGNDIWEDAPVSKSIRNLVADTFFDDRNKRHLLAIPLQVGNVPNGVLLLSSDQEFEKQEIEIVAVLSTVLGNVLKRSFKEATSLNLSVRQIDSPEPLTSRQLRILALMGEKKTNADIARELMMSESTIRQESVRIFRALGVSDRFAAVKRGEEFGLISANKNSLPLLG